MNKSQGKKKSSRSIQEDFFVLLEAGLRTAGRVTKREFDRVTDNIQERLEKKYGKEKVEDYTRRAKANWEEMVQRVRNTGERIEVTDSFRKGKEIGVQVLEGLASALKKAAENLEASLSDRVTFHAGQVLDKGVYVCIDCKKIQELKRRRKLSACPECGSTEFRQA